MTKFLWTGESEYCQCGHHITKHSTRNNWLNIWESDVNEDEPNYLCYGSRGCKCKKFIPYRLEEPYPI